MPSAPLRYCPAPGCPARVTSGRCAVHARQQEQQRPNADVRRWYCQARWRRLRRLVLATSPLCSACHVAIAVDVDHVQPHRGDVNQFFDIDGLTGLWNAAMQ